MGKISTSATKAPTLKVYESIEDMDEEGAYEYQQLPESLKETVLEKLADINLEPHEWWENTYDCWRDDLADMGFGDVDIRFTGFYSQGDGASFTANLELEQYIKHNKLELENLPILGAIDLGWTFTAWISRDTSNYVHQNTISFHIEAVNEIDSDSEEEDMIMKDVDSLEVAIEGHIKDLCGEIYRGLRNVYEELSSRDAIEYTIDSNEYKFDVSGNIV